MAKVFEESNEGALKITYTILGVPYYIQLQCDAPQNPTLIIKGPYLKDSELQQIRTPHTFPRA